MKINKVITAALISLGLVSAASASSSVTIGGNTYTVVYITGSTAFRQNVFNSVDSNAGLGSGVFDATPTLQPTSATGGTSAYNAYGTINSVRYLLSFDFTGSEAGIAALEGNTITYAVPTGALPTSPSSGIATLPGTPMPTGFINPNNISATVSAVPDLAFADTSVAVSLSPASGVKEDGIVGVIPFEWCKGKMSTPDQSWLDLTNVTTPQALTMLGTGHQQASFFTKAPGDVANVYLVGRNKGSGTRVNTLLETYYGVTTAVKQWAAGNSGYISGVLTVGPITALTTSTNGLAYIVNEGFDAGSGVSTTLRDDSYGFHLPSTTPDVITLGYLGISDALAAVGGGASSLELDGNLESDGSVILGSYPFWGHEHLYGLTTQSSTTPGGVIADDFTGLYSVNGGTPNSGISGANAAAGALEATGFAGGGGDEASSAWLTTQSTALDGGAMECDKPSDAGYPTQQ